MTLADFVDLVKVGPPEVRKVGGTVFNKVPQIVSKLLKVYTVIQ